MTQTNPKALECDRCGFTETNESAANSFDCWVQLSSTCVTGVPILTSHGATRGYICPTCVNDLYDWWRRLKAESKPDQEKN